MKALTLIQPWAYAIAHLGKDVENRTWRPPASVIGTRIAIHAGAKFDRAAATDLLVNGFSLNQGQPPAPSASTQSAIVATAKVTGFWTGDHDRPWYAGPVGWVLKDVVALPQPVPCKGALGLWTVPEHVEERVVEQVRDRLAELP